MRVWRADGESQQYYQRKRRSFEDTDVASHANIFLFPIKNIKKNLCSQRFLVLCRFILPDGAANCWCFFLGGVQRMGLFP